MTNGVKYQPLPASMDTPSGNQSFFIRGEQCLNSSNVIKRYRNRRLQYSRLLLKRVRFHYEKSVTMLFFLM